MIRLTAPERGTDDFGSGAWDASRIGRRHKGIDYKAQPGSIVHSITDGFISKLGYVYQDDLSWRYVEVTDKNDHRIRYFYVKPSVQVGDDIKADDTLGSVQNLDLRYKGITPHIHLGVKNLRGVKINPKEYLKEYL